MNTLYEHSINTEQIPKRDDGTFDLQEAMRQMLESLANTIMDEQADELCGENNRRNGYRTRQLATCVGSITLKIPKLREGSYFPEDIIVPYSRSDKALICAIAEMYTNGVSTRKVERIAKEMGFEKISKSSVSRMCACLDQEVEELVQRDLCAITYPYLWLDATYISCRDNGRVRNLALVTAIAASAQNKREFVGLDVVDVESRSSWKAFLRSLRARGLKGVLCVVSDAHSGLTAAIREVFPGATWQRCIVHLERDIASKINKKADRQKAMRLLKAVFEQKDERLVKELYSLACLEISKIKPSLGELLEDAEVNALAYLDYPREHHIWIRTNNIQERANREIKRRTRVVQVFPSQQSLIRLAGAICCEINDSWSCMNFMSAQSLENIEKRLIDNNANKETKERAIALINDVISAIDNVA